LKRKSVTLVLLTVAILLVAFGVQSTKVMATTVGVNVGEGAEYSVSVNGYEPSLNLSNQLFDLKFTVVRIIDTNITCKDSETFLNGTQETNMETVDVETGSGNFSGIIIPANLNEGDLIYTGPWSTGDLDCTNATINETVTRNYLGSNVQVNHLSLTEQLANSSGIEGTTIVSMNLTGNWFWLKDSGILAEADEDSWFLNTQDETFWLSSSISITRIVSEFPVSMILPLFIALSTLAVVSAKKRLPKNEEQQNSQMKLSG
jgi:hypothetical protein